MILALELIGVIGANVDRAHLRRRQIVERLRQTTLNPIEDVERFSTRGMATSTRLFIASSIRNIVSMGRGIPKLRDAAGLTSR